MLDEDLLVYAEGRIGTVLCGKYTLDRVIGVGGMAVVYAATHRNQKRVAIKMLLPELSIRQEVRARFLREGYAANTVDHPGAVSVLDDDTTEDGAAFLVMELLEGDDVERLWEKHGNRLDARVVMAIADQMLGVLQAAHAKSVVHRDIKPANLYLTSDGSLKVLDFGIARVRTAAFESRHTTRPGLSIGTPAYMAPEQALGKSNEIDATTDVWSAGATLFALLSGEMVHEGDSMTAVLVQAATQPARSLAEVAPRADPHVVAIVDRALAFDRAARWPDAATMRESVREAYLAMFGTKVSKEPLEQLLAASAMTAAKAHAPSLSPPTSRVPADAGAMYFTPRGTRLEAALPLARPSLPRMGTMTASPSSTGGEPDGRPLSISRKSSLLLPAIVAGIAIVACAAIGLAVWRGSSTPIAGAGVPGSTLPSAPPPISSAPPVIEPDEPEKPEAPDVPPPDISPPRRLPTLVPSTPHSVAQP